MHRARDLIVCFWDLAGGGPVCNAPTVADKGSTMTRRCTTRRAARAFTLIEAVIVVALAAMLVTMAIPAFDSVRTDARLAGSRDNLATLGKANAGYAVANAGLIGGYDWDEDDAIGEPGIFGQHEFDLGGGATASSQSGNRLEFAQLQQAAILRRATGRFHNPLRIWVNFNRLPQRYFNHIPLIDWFSGLVTDPIAVSPLDVNQQLFQRNPLNYELLPGGIPEYAGEGWSGSDHVINRWPFASSYRSTVYAWSPSRPVDTVDCRLALEPADDGTLTQVNSVSALVPQPMADVAFPSQKSHYFENYDYREGLGTAGRYYARPDAASNVLFFDGSARLNETADANPGWDASNLDDMQSPARLSYDAIDRRYFPDHGDAEFAAPHLWTRGGLEGIDVGAGEINTENWCE